MRPISTLRLVPYTVFDNSQELVMSCDAPDELFLSVTIPSPRQLLSLPPERLLRIRSEQGAEYHRAVGNWINDRLDSSGEKVIESIELYSRALLQEVREAVNSKLDLKLGRYIRRGALVLQLLKLAVPELAPYKPQLDALSVLANLSYLSYQFYETWDTDAQNLTFTRRFTNCIGIPQQQS